MVLILGAENALKQGIKGTFTWKSWATDVAITGSTALITTGVTSLAVWGTTISMMVDTAEVTHEVFANILKCTQITGSLVGGCTAPAAETIKKVIKAEKVDPTLLFIMLVTGVLQGLSIGTTVTESMLPLPEVTDTAIETKLNELCANEPEMM